MKKTTLAIMLLAFTVPVLAQTGLPQCDVSNFDAARGLFTISASAETVVNQQCLLVVNAKGTVSRYPANHFVEGTYNIEISAGGGGGAAGATQNQGGGGGGAGAKVTKTTSYLAPGIYKLTIGAGGMGGKAPSGSLATDGNPSSLTKHDSGQLVAGFPGADTWTSRSPAPTIPGAGGTPRDGTGGGDGAGAGSSTADQGKAQDGSKRTTSRVVSANAGKAGGETVNTKANAGGGGGAGGGRGGDGQSAGFNSAVAGAGVLGGGGGGGRGGMFTARSGAAGGDGFIRITAQ